MTVHILRKIGFRLFIYSFKYFFKIYFYVISTPNEGLEVMLY